MSQDFADVPMSELFRLEGETHLATLTDRLLRLEKQPTPQNIEALMRAAHSLKGAARIVNFDGMVRLAHVLEDLFVSFQKSGAAPSREQIDGMLAAVDIMARMLGTVEEEYATWNEGEKQEILNSALEKLKGSPKAASTASVPPAQAPVPAKAPAADPSTQKDQYLRLTASNISRIVGLASESLVHTRSLPEVTRNLGQLRKHQAQMHAILDRLREQSLGQGSGGAPLLEEARQRSNSCARSLLDLQTTLDQFSRKADRLSARLYSETVSARMRPFGDILGGFPRFVRDTGKLLGKEVELRIEGEDTAVDRDILEKLDAPLTHLLRNAIDHGIEFPDVRALAGKPAEGTITISARHQSGRLLVEIRDDGRGISIERIRETVIARKLSPADLAANFSPAEVLEFLFLPGFSLKEEVTELSGRGVGLDAVQSEVKRLRGAVRIISDEGKGTTFQLSLPLTLSIVRALIVKIAGDPYAIPLTRIGRVLKVSNESVHTIEGREYVEHLGKKVGLIKAAQVLDLAEEASTQEQLSVVLFGEGEQTYGLVVEAFLGHRELVLLPLSPRLGKIQDVASGAILPDGSPVLVLEIDDLMRSMELLITGGRLSRVQMTTGSTRRQRKSVLVVDDSLTVRELERKLLQARGYDVSVAVDGMDGWNDLLITDIDMPRMDGIELVTLLKRDSRLRDVPAMIVSYKDREEDRRRGLDAGADFYLTKGSFHDESLLKAVAQLIGEP
jgi:two-component system, chemotaxis family, sensor histidine kinase and response regulator WspE